MDIDRTPFERRFADLRTNSQPWETHWKDLQKYIFPPRGNFDDRPNQNIALDYKAMVDGEPMSAASTLASGMLAGLTSPAMPWFTLGVADPALNDAQAVRIWLDDVRELLMGIFAKSNIYIELYNLYEELGIFASGCVGVFSDFNNVLRAQTFTAGEYYLSPDENGRIRTFGRMFSMTTENLIAKFGKENVSNTTRTNYQANNLYSPVKVYHMIEPNDGRDPSRKDNRNMPFRSIYWEEAQEAGKALRLSGFKRFPILGPRWGVRTSSEAYGRGSPGWRALGDSKTLQAMSKDELKGLAKVVDPPMQAPSGMKNEVINALPGAINYYGESEKQTVIPLYAVNPDINAIEMAIQSRRDKINRYFFTDLFRMLQQRDSSVKTAREVAELHEEKIMVLSPVLESTETEVLDPLIDLAFAYAQEAGLLADPPDELQGMDLKVEYISVLAQSQKMIGVTSMVDHSTFVLSLAQAFPDVLDTLNADEMATEYGSRIGTPAKTIRSKEEIAQIRAARAKQQQEAAAMQNTATAIEGAKVLSETKTDTPSALTALLGGPGGGLG